MYESTTPLGGKAVPQLLDQLGLRFNPFEPSGSGAPLSAEDLWLPESWRRELRELLDLLSTSSGVKALAIPGEYGSGKTYVLQWLYREELPKRRTKPFYFDNPGVQFYDLAESLLRQIGRKDFAKYLWELSAVHVDAPFQKNLFAGAYEEYVLGHRQGTRTQQKAQMETVTIQLQEALQEAGVTRDEEIAFRLARTVAETPTKPYFEYRDFVAGSRETLVAENEEAPYFAAVLKTLRLAEGAQAVAFLVDEFEEISLQKRLTRRDAHDYLATLKRLVNLTREEDFWVILAMTPDSAERSRELEPALWERFTGDGRYQFKIPQLSTSEAMGLIEHRLGTARMEGHEPPTKLLPFPEELGDILSPIVMSSPRRLVKVCFYAVSDAGGEPVPFTPDYLREVESKAYPAVGVEG